MRQDYLIYEYRNMFNQYQYNNSVFNQVINVTNTIPQDDIVYNNYWLQNSTVVTSFADYDNWPSIQNDFFNRPRTDWGWELNYFFRERVITLKWTIKSTTSESLIQEIDRFKKALWVNQQNLDIKINWVIRRAKASVINFDTLFRKENYHITFIPFEVQFRVIKPFFAEITRQIQSFTWLTADLTEEMINGWSITTNPVVLITFTAATSVTQISFTANSKTITISETINTNDVVKIDCDAKTVTINDVTKDYSWVFPEFVVWWNSYTIDIDGTFTYDITTYFFNQYI